MGMLGFVHFHPTPVAGLPQAFDEAFDEARQGGCVTWLRDVAARLRPQAVAARLRPQREGKAKGEDRRSRIKTQENT